jgi:hypothetical protein
MPISPTTLGYGSAAVSLGGGIASVFVGYRQAKELEDRAVREAAKIRRAGDRILGAQTVAYAHGGVTQQGTPQDIRNDSIAEIEREVFRSTQGFEDAANRNIDMGWLNLSGALSQAATTVATTKAGKPGATALFGRTGPTRGISLGGGGARASGGPTVMTTEEAGTFA